MIRVFLCDDDPSYLEYLSGIVGQFFQQNKIEAGIKTFLDGETLLEEPEMADLVFLDVEMPEKSGIEIGKCIKEKNLYALIFIVSFTERYLDDAMDFHVFRYIEKSTLSDRIMRNLSDALVAYKNTNPKITITQNGETIVCREADIVMIENQKRCVHIYTMNHKYVVKGKLEDWEQKLNQIRFCKSHTSFLVNLDYVSRFTKNEIVLAKGKYTAHVSRRMYVKFCKMYEEYLRRG